MFESTKTGGGSWLTRRRLAGLALAALSGALATVSAPPYNIWPLALIAWVPAIIADFRILEAPWTGAALAVSYTVWIGSQVLPGMMQAGVSPLLLPLPAIAGAGIYFLRRRSVSFHQRTAYRWFWLSTPAGWVALDGLRALGPSVLAGTWGNPSYAFWSQPAMLQPLSIFGMYGLELLLLSVNWALAGLAIAVADLRSGTSARLPLGPALRTAMIVAAAAVAWRLLPAPEASRGRELVRVAAIQPGPNLTRAAAQQAAVARTREAAAAGAKLIVWPEALLHFDPRRIRTAELPALSAQSRAWLVAGFSAVDASFRRINMAVVFSPEKGLMGVYGKSHPGTFAGDYSEEESGYAVWRTDFGSIAAIICYDLDFTDSARAIAALGAEILAVPSNDPDPFLAETHYTHLVFRAIENRISIIKSDRMRDAAAVDPWGHVIARAVDSDGRASTLIADLPRGSARSPYVRFGDFIVWICAIAWMAVQGFEYARSWRRRRHSAEEALNQVE